MTTTFITFFESARNDEHPVVDLLNLAECRFTVVLRDAAVVKHFFQEHL